jgi:Ca2+-dependent lipid-binding protein
MNNQERCASKGGWFYGSKGALQEHQTQADIFLSNYWETVGFLKRITVRTVRWGISVLTVQVAQAAAAGQPGIFQDSPMDLALVNM